MDELFFHPRMVHIPIALGALMPLVAAGLLLAWWRKWLPRRGWLVALGLQAILVGSGVVALRTGEAHEERVERVVAKRFIHRHEEAAEVFVWTAGAVLGVMVLALALPSRRWRLALATAAVVGTLVDFGLGYRTGQLGGELVYVHGAAEAHLPGSPRASTGGVSSDQPRGARTSQR